MNSNDGDNSKEAAANELSIETDSSDFGTESDFESDSSDFKPDAADIGNIGKVPAPVDTSIIARRGGSRFGIRRKLLSFASLRHNKPTKVGTNLQQLSPREKATNVFVPGRLDIPEVEPNSTESRTIHDAEKTAETTIAFLDNRRLDDIKVATVNETSSNVTDCDNLTAQASTSTQSTSVFGLRKAFATLRIKDSSKKRTPLHRSNTDTSRSIVVKQPRSSLDVCCSRDRRPLVVSAGVDPNDYIRPILEELVATEESYVANIWYGINTYGQIFQRPDLPEDLQAKEYELLANIEAIATLHRDQVLPMLRRNHDNAESIFLELQKFVEENQFHIYIAYTINKRRSMQLIARHKVYFVSLEKEFADRLGISSFLLEPIQRLARYPLLISQCISTLFKKLCSNSKALVTICCRLETKLRTLLNTINESECINDIVEVNVTNMFNSFRRVGDFEIYDHGRWRSYHGKLFLFDKCLIITKIAGKQLVYRRRYSCDVVQIAVTDQGFCLFYGNRVENKCDFTANAEQVEQWLKLIQAVITVDPVNLSEKESLEEDDDEDEDEEEYAPRDYDKVSEFQIYDHTLERKYQANVFLFEECIAYAEVKGEHMRLRGRYPFDHVGVSPSEESFTLFYDRRHQQECDFMGKPKLIKEWLDVIHGQISTHFKRKMSIRGSVGSAEVDSISITGSE